MSLNMVQFRPLYLLKVIECQAPILLLIVLSAKASLETNF